MYVHVNRDTSEHSEESLSLTSRDAREREGSRQGREGQDETEREREREKREEREEAASAFVLSPVQRYLSDSIAEETTLVSSIRKKKKRNKQNTLDIKVCLPPHSKYSSVSSVPPLCISQSSPDRNPLLQWGYILPRWIQAPAETPASPGPLLTPPPQAACPPAPPDRTSPRRKKATAGWR